MPFINHYIDSLPDQLKCFNPEIVRHIKKPNWNPDNPPVLYLTIPISEDGEFIINEFLHYLHFIAKDPPQEYKSVFTLSLIRKTKDQVAYQLELKGPYCFYTLTNYPSYNGLVLCNGERTCEENMKSYLEEYNICHVKTGIYIGPYLSSPILDLVRKYGEDGILLQLRLDK